MQLEFSQPEIQRPSRKGKERDLMHRDSPKDPQPTDLDEKLIAFRRRTAAASRPRDKSERPAPPPPPPARQDRSPRPAPPPPARPSPSPRKHHLSPQLAVSRPSQEADPDDFSRRLKISPSSPSARPAQVAKQSHKLFDPDRDPIPMRRTAEPETMSDAASSYASRNGPREAAARQLFNHRKDDPVRFSVLARTPGRPPPTPKSSGDYISASSTSSYAASQTSSSFTLSSTTDGSSASSALFEGQRKSAEEQGTNVFAVQLKKLYRTITSLESKVNQDDLEENEDSSRILLKGKEVENEDLEKEKWKKKISDHKSLVENIHNLLEISLAPSVPASLRNIPTKYNIIVRLWTYGFHKLLESLRRSSFTSPLAMEHLQDFIYYAYTFYTGLLEEPTLSTFKSGWLEALGDLARYRMAVAAMVTGITNSGGSLTAANVSEVVRTASTPSSDGLAPPVPDGAKSISDAPAARIDDSPSPSVGLAAARLLDVEPEKERWRGIARDWYGTGLTDQPGTGKLHHHLGLLSREVEGEELRGVYHFVKSMTTLHPFMTSRESVLPIWSAAAQARRSLPDARVPDLFVLLHGMLFTNIQLDDFQPTLARFVERLEIEGAEDREWMMMAAINIGSILEYGKPSGVLKRIGGVGPRDSGTAAAMRVMAKRELLAEDRMDVDEPTVQVSPALSEMEADSGELPYAFKLALQITFTMVSHVLRRPMRKISPFARSTVNPYLTVVLTFLATILKHEASREVLERSIPWEELAKFFAIVPRSIMTRQGLDKPVPRDTERWTMVTNGCAPPLAEDWCLRGMEWVARKVYERGFWKSGEDRKAELEVLNEAEAQEMTDGQIEDDDNDDSGERKSSDIGKRWVRIIRCAVGIASVVDGFTWVQGTREWRVEGKLAEKVVRWREEDAREREAEERRRMGNRWVDDSMDIDDGPMDVSEESESDDENDTDAVKALKARRRYLQSLLHSGQATLMPISSSRRKCRKNIDTRPPLPVLAGYTVLVVDTNILLSSLLMFASIVESLRWTVVVPLPVIMELDGLSSNPLQLGEAAQSAMAYISSHIRTHSTSLKVQTSKGNYLTTLNVRTEEVDFTNGTSDRNMDDLILKAAIWHDEHWVDRSALLRRDAIDRNIINPVKVVLLSLDRNLRLKARSRQLPAASERDLASILSKGV
ncbi:hypothetical protein DFS33DRAFT_302757 [Desarmillaria ectypa]|nr:hypothetical protein DFS33DRAFT_302757 [Desarmillaria ectypa]